MIHLTHLRNEKIVIVIQVSVKRCKPINRLLFKAAFTPKWETSLTVSNSQRPTVDNKEDSGMRMGS